MLCCSLWFFLLHNTFFFPKDPLYYWQQTEDDLTVTIQLPEACTKEDIQVQFLPDSVNIVLKGLAMEARQQKEKGNPDKK